MHRSRLKHLYLKQLQDLGSAAEDGGGGGFARPQGRVSGTLGADTSTRDLAGEDIRRPGRERGGTINVRAWRGSSRKAPG
jgi:hypothetical protein